MTAKTKKKAASRPAKTARTAAKKTASRSAGKPAAKAAPKKTSAKTASKSAGRPAAKGAQAAPAKKRGRPTLSPNGLVGSNISLRMPPELYGYLKKTGKNWQTRVVRHLMAEMEKKAAWMKG